MKKYLYIILSIITIFLLNILLILDKKEENSIISKFEKNNVLGYSVDGIKTKTMPKKGSGYVANTISCQNKSILVWDNDNWKLEIITINDNDECTIDFTKDTTKSSSRVTLTSILSLVDVVDSTSKTVTSNGSVSFYLSGYIVDSISNCNASLNNDKDIITLTNVTENISCKISYIKKINYLKDTILADNPTIVERADFSTLNELDTTGIIYRTNKTEDGSDVYYYSGNTTNNWVVFGYGTLPSCMYEEKEVLYYDGKNYTYNIGTEEECLKNSTICQTNSDYVIGMSEEKCVEEGYTLIEGTPYYSEDNDFYWRIIRTNEDGSVRLLYSGTSPNTKRGYIDLSAYNISMNDPMYVGYMYGTSGSLENNRKNTNNSTIKTVIDKWYEDNLLEYYDIYISKEAIYCNDRSIGDGRSYYGTSGITSFGSSLRIETNKLPSYKCGANASNGLFTTYSNEDNFSVSNEYNGNEKLNYPIGLITADELVFAGGVVDMPIRDSHIWYAMNSENSSITHTTHWWTMSPGMQNYKSTNMFSVFNGLDNSGDGFITNNVYRITSTGAVRPVISLSPCVKVSGSGTAEDPYIIDEDASTCE